MKRLAIGVVISIAITSIGFTAIESTVTSVAFASYYGYFMGVVVMGIFQFVPTTRYESADE